MRLKSRHYFVIALLFRVSKVIARRPISGSVRHHVTRRPVPTLHPKTTTFRLPTTPTARRRRTVLEPSSAPNCHVTRTARARQRRRETRPRVRTCAARRRRATSSASWPDVVSTSAGCRRPTRPGSWPGAPSARSCCATAPTGGSSSRSAFRRSAARRRFDSPATRRQAGSVSTATALSAAQCRPSRRSSTSSGTTSDRRRTVTACSSTARPPPASPWRWRPPWRRSTARRRWPSSSGRASTALDVDAWRNTPSRRARRRSTVSTVSWTRCRRTSTRRQRTISGATLSTFEILTTPVIEDEKLNRRWDNVTREPLDAIPRAELYRFRTRFRTLAIAIGIRRWYHSIRRMQFNISVPHWSNA